MSMARFLSLCWACLAVAAWLSSAEAAVISGFFVLSGVWHAADWLARKGCEA